MDFLKGKINKLYFTFLASALGSTLITTVYSTVDLIAIGQYAGPVGAAAVACVNPLWPCMLTLGILAGMGGSVMMNNRRGAQDTRAGNEFFTVSMAFSLVASVAVFVCFNIFMEDLLTLFGAEGEVLSAALEYAKPIAFSAPCFTLCSTASSFVRNDGEAFLPTFATVVGGVINVFGDIFFVFDFGLGLGLFGAGLATAIGQTVSFLLIISYFAFKKCKLRFVFPKKLLPKLAKIVSVGASAAIIELAFGVTTVVFNNLITENLSDVHLAAYGVASSVLVMLYCFYYALGTAAQPIVSANFGAGNGERVKKTLKIALISAVVMSTLFTALTQAFPETILKIYIDVDASVLEIGPRVVRLYNLALPVASIAIVACYYLQSVLRQTMATTISFLRGLLLPILFAFLIPQLWGYEYIWLAVPLAEAASAAVATVFIVISNKKL